MVCQVWEEEINKDKPLTLTELTTWEERQTSIK